MAVAATAAAAVAMVVAATAVAATAAAVAATAAAVSLAVVDGRAERLGNSRMSLWRGWKRTSCKRRLGPKHTCGIWSQIGGPRPDSVHTSPDLALHAVSPCLQTAATSPLGIKRHGRSSLPGPGLQNPRAKQRAGSGGGGGAPVGALHFMQQEQLAVTSLIGCVSVFCYTGG